MTENEQAATINPPLSELRGAAFRMPLPEGWVDRSIYCAGGPVAEGFQSSIVVTLEHKPELSTTDLESYFDAQLTTLEGRLEEFDLKARGRESIAGRSGFRAHFGWKSPEGVPLRQTQWYLHTPPNVILVTATAHAATFDDQRELLERVARGLVLQGGGLR